MALVHHLLDPLPGGTVSEATAISPSGNVIVGWSRSSDSTSRAVRWIKSGDTYGAPEDLGALPGGNVSIAYGISEDETTIVGQSDVSDPNPFLIFNAFSWTSGGGMVQLTNFSGLIGDPDDVAKCCSSDGSKIFGEARGTGTGNNWPCIWETSGTVITKIPIPDGADGFGGITGCTPDATVVCGTYGNTDPGQKAAIWSDVFYATLTDLGNLGGTVAIAFGISADGLIVAGASRDGSEISFPFRWTVGDGMVSLGVPAGGASGGAACISADGTTIGGSSNAPVTAFIWSADVFTELFGLVIDKANGVSGDGATPVGFVSTSDSQAAWWGPDNPPPDVRLNMDNVVVTSLATESPCTTAQFPGYTTVGPQLVLRWSDTRGDDWGNPVPQDFSTDPYWQGQWNRTGMARDRVFELFWSASFNTALNGAFVEVKPLKS